MINFSAVPRSGRPGRILRRILGAVPKGATVRVLQGPLRGARWVVGSGVHGYWLGSFEAEKQRLLARSIPPGGNVLDLGANVGFYTLLASRCVGPAGRVCAFEPLPRNVEHLRRHLALNRAGNVRVFPCAVGREAGVRRFTPGKTPAQGHFAPHGEIEVEVRTLDTLFLHGEIPPPDVVKVDVEGAELEVLEGGRRMLAEAAPVIFLATHGREVLAECLAFLERAGYTVRVLSENAPGELAEVLAVPAPAPRS